MIETCYGVFQTVVGIEGDLARFAKRVCNRGGFKRQGLISVLQPPGYTEFKLFTWDHMRKPNKFEARSEQ